MFGIAFKSENSLAIYHQILAVIPICLNEFVLGIGFGWLAPMVKMFLDDPNSEMKPTEDECSWIASLPLFGKTFGPVFSILLLDIIGRKLLLQIGGVVFFIMWLAILFTRSVYILYIVFFTFGISVGISNAVSAVYIGENCSPKIRGLLCGASVTCFYLAVLTQFTLCAFLSYNTITVVSLVIVTSYLVITLLLVETPQFLMLKDRFNEAEANLMWLNGTKERADTAEEFEKIKLNIIEEKQKKTSLVELFSAPANRKSLIIVLIMNVCHAATGNVAIFTYVSLLFPSNDLFTSDQSNISFGVLELLTCFLSSLVIEKFNRRTMTLFSYFLFLFCHSINAFLYFIIYRNIDLIPFTYCIWLLLILICIFSGFSATADAVVHMIRGELFPQSIKPVGSGLAIIVHSLMSFLTIKTFLMIRASCGIYMNFFIYAIVSLLSFTFTYFALPETRGKSLIDIQKSLERSKSSSRIK